MFPLFAVLALAVSIKSADAYRVSCYYRYTHRGLVLNEEKLRNINCTHIIVGFASVGSDSKVNISSLGTVDDLKTVVQNVKSPERRVMLSVGGGDQISKEMLAERRNIDIHVSSVADLVRYASFDGVDFDWEFPSLWERDNFSYLLESIRTAFDNITGKAESLDLSVALPGPITLTAGYDTDVIKRTCTFLNVMTYDLVLFSKWRPQAALHNALYGQGFFLNPLHLFSVDVSMKNWVELGIPADMLLMGLPTYGVAYELKNKDKAALFATVTGYSHLGSNLNYDQICQIVRDYPQGYHFYEKSRVPYATDNNGTWVSYDNPESIIEKVQFAVKQNYSGLMIFSLNADDPSGNCSGDPASAFPLTQIAVAALREASKMR